MKRDACRVRAEREKESGLRIWIHRLTRTTTREPEMEKADDRIFLVMFSLRERGFPLKWRRDIGTTEDAEYTEVARLVRSGGFSVF